MTFTDENVENSAFPPKIALIVDVENWAFHNSAKQIAERLSDSYDFRIFFYGEYEEIADLMLEVKNFDLVHFFWRGALLGFLSRSAEDSFARRGENYNDFVTSIVAEANITTSVYDHLYLSEKEIREQAILYNALSVAYTTCSQKLALIYSSIADYPPPHCVIENGIDLKLFSPLDAERFYAERDEIVVGWAGNSKWGGDGIDHKGLETIIKPAIESLREEGGKVRGFYADRQERWIPHDEMNDYYNSIDIYVCASDAEGSPDPVLEAMACGVPVISTDVGIVPEMFGALQKEYILSARNAGELKVKLKELVESPGKRAALSKENLESIKNRAWHKQCAKWDAFFKSVLFDARRTRLKKRRNYLRKQTLDTYLKLNSNRELIANLENKIGESKTALDFSDNRIGALENWTIELQANLRNSQNRIADLEKWTVEFQANLRNSQNRIADLENWTVELQTALRNSETYASELEKRTRELQSSLDEARLKLDEARLKNVRAQEELEQNRDARQKTEVHITNLNDIITSLKANVTAMEASRFWKLRNQWFKLKDTVRASDEEK